MENQESNLDLDSLLMAKLENSNDSNYMFVDCAPPDEDVQERTPQTPSKQSQYKYEHQYNRFHKWRKLTNANGISEHLMLAYITERSKLVNAATLWSELSMLKTMIKAKENEDIGGYHSVQAFLKQNSKGYSPTHSNTLTKEQCLTFLREAPNETYLMMKVALIMGIYGACRKVELLNMKLGDLKQYNDYILVTIDERDNYSARSFMITNDTMDNINVLAFIKNYLALRPSQSPQERLFIYLKLNKDNNVTPVGKNALSKIPNKIATYLKLDEPESYSGHCFRRSAATLTNKLFRKGGQRKSAIADDSMDDLMEKKRKLDPLNNDGTETITVNSTTDEIVFDNSITDADVNLTLPSTSGAITIRNCPQGVINIYYQK